MPVLVAIAFCTLLVGSLAQEAGASTLRESYTARLSERDHFNSRGVRLKSAAAIIRQDRANFHKFGKRDKEDQSDRFFSDMANRGLLEKFINRGKSTKGALDAVVNSTPLVIVKIYEDLAGNDYVTVTVVD